MRLRLYNLCAVCDCRYRRLKLESPADSEDPFTYVRQVNNRDGSWTLPSGSTLLVDSPTLPASYALNPGHVGQNNSTTDRLILPENVCGDPDRASLSRPKVIASRSTEAEVVVEKQTQTQNCCTAPEAEKFEESEPASETGSRVELEPKVVTGTGSFDETEPKVVTETGSVEEMEPKAVSGTGSREELEPKSVAETCLGDTESVISLNPSLSEDYCNRVIDEAFFAIDNFAYSDNQSDAE